MTEQQKWAAKIDALLRKAESTTPEEAESLIGKAQELMTKYMIDEAMLQAAGKEKKDEIVTEEFVMTGGFRVALGNLCSAIIRYNGGRAVLSQNLPRDVDGKTVKQTYILFATGYKSDIDRIRVLYTSLHLQGIRAQASWWNEVKDEYDDVYKTKRQGFLDRRQFLFSYASRVGWRLKEGYERAHAAAQKQHGTGMEIVLRDRSLAIDDEMTRLYGRLRSVKQRQTGGSYQSQEAGDSAGRRADLGGTRFAGSKKQIER